MESWKWCNSKRCLLLDRIYVIRLAMTLPSKVLSLELEMCRVEDSCNVFLRKMTRSSLDVFDGHSR
jgi:hypothetical protein